MFGYPTNIGKTNIQALPKLSHHHFHSWAHRVTETRGEDLDAWVNQEIASSNVCFTCLKIQLNLQDGTCICLLSVWLSACVETGMIWSTVRLDSNATQLLKNDWIFHSAGRAVLCNKNSRVHLHFRCVADVDRRLVGEVTPAHTSQNAQAKYNFFK